jgi:hypothetical protein
LSREFGNGNAVRGVRLPLRWQKQKSACRRVGRGASLLPSELPYRTSAVSPQYSPANLPSSTNCCTLIPDCPYNLSEGEPRHA